MLTCLQAQHLPAADLPLKSNFIGSNSDRLGGGRHSAAKQAVCRTPNRKISSSAAASIASSGNCEMNPDFVLHIHFEIILERYALRLRKDFAQLPGRQPMLYVARVPRLQPAI